MEFLANISNFSLIYDLLIYVPEGLQGALESTANIYLTSTKVSKTLHKKKLNFSAYVNLLCSFRPRMHLLGFEGRKNLQNTLITAFVKDLLLLTLSAKPSLAVS